ncbi:MAG TPA: hypothetical protein VFT72_03195 [Opitutaceae bacterium]|nr:hypothetical protein [Opitutaceae bacterium]
MFSTDNSNPDGLKMSLTLPKRSSAWLGFVALLIAIAYALFVIMSYSGDQQRLLAATLTVRALNCCLIVGGIGLALVLIPVLKSLERRVKLTTVGFLVFGFLICGLAPKTNRIFFDEHIYMHVGQSIAHTGRAEAPNYARVEYGAYESYSSWVNKQPNGHPYVLSLVYRIFGVSSSISFVVNRVWVGLAAASIFLALHLLPWSLPKGSAFLAAALYCFTPLVIWWGHTVAVEPGASGSVAVAFLMICLHARFRFSAEPSQNSAPTWIIMAAAVAFSAYFRPESLLVYGVFVAFLWASDKRFVFDFSTWASLALAISLTIPTLLHLWSVRTEDWGATDGRRFASDFIPANLASNGGYFFNGKWFPFAGTVLGLAGLVWLFRKQPKGALALLVWLGASWGIFILFYAGGYHYGASSRYAVVSTAPIAIAMGIGGAYLWFSCKKVPAIRAFLVGLGALNWASAMHYVPTIGRESAEARADVTFVERVAPTLPEGSLVISSNPCIWNIEGVNSSQFFTIENMVRTELIELRNQYPGGIYVHWNFWHNVEPTMADDARRLIADTEATRVASMTSQDHEMAIMRVDTPAAIAKFGGHSKPSTRINRMVLPSSSAPSTTP